MNISSNKNSIIILGIMLALLAGCGNKNNAVAPPTPPPAAPTNTSSNVPVGTADGVTFYAGGDSAIFNLFAPGKKSVYLIGDFNNWSTAATPMTNTSDGSRWWVKIGGLDPSKTYTYQYYIDGSLKVADPYSHTILDPANDQYIPSGVYPNLPAYPAGQTGIVSVMQANPAAYTWQTTNFTPASPSNLVVYELWVGDFLDQDNTSYTNPNFATPNNVPNYATLTDSLNYIAKLGVNAIELLPVNEFEGNISWGYNPNYLMALDKYYGTPNAYKAFIDACHARGIAVIQDIVLEDQFGSSPMVQMYWNATTGTPAQNNPWFDSLTLHPYGVGYQMDYGTAANRDTATVYYAKNVMKYWIQEYHIDGFRFDQAQGYTQTNSIATGSLWGAYDADRVNLWTTFNTYMKSLNPNFYVILEDFAASTEIQAMAAQGMMCWNNQSTAGEQADMGYATNPSWDFSSLVYQSFGITQPNGLMSYFESHDEERLQYKNANWGNSSGSYNVQTLATGLSRDGMMAAFLFSVPGPKMLWQFGERGYDLSKNSYTTSQYPGMGSTSYGSLAPMPANWNYMQDPNRVALYNIYAAMIHYKTNNTVFTTTSFTYSLSGAVKWIQLLGSDGTDVEVVGNFDVVPNTASLTFPASGTWYDNLLGGNISLATTAYNATLQPCEYHVYSNVVLK